MVTKVAKMPSPAPESQSGPLVDPKPPLHRALISYTGLTIPEREEVNKKVRAMGGQVSVDLTEDITHLIAKKVGSPKYKASFSSEKQRQDVLRETIQHGGKYTNDLLKGITTHLICDQPTGEKYTSALQWGIKCVPRQWFRDTLSNLDRRKSANGKAMAGLQKEPDHGDNLDDETFRIIPTSTYLELCQIYLCPSFSQALITRFKKLIRAAGGVHIADYDSESVTHVLVPSDKLAPTTMDLFKSETTLTPYIVNQQWLRNSNREGKALPETDYIVPFPTRTEDGQPKPARFEGSTTWSTDKLVNSRDMNGGAKSNFATLRNQPKAPTTAVNQSGAESMAYRNKADESPTTTPPSYKPVNSPSNLSPQQTRNGLQTRTASGFLSDTLVELSINATPQLHQSTQNNSMTEAKEPPPPYAQDEAQVPSIFLGLYVTSHGIKSTAMVQMIREQTVAYGGTYFDESETIPTDAPVKTIVPHTIPLEETSNLKGVVMTIFWLERSLVEEKVIPRSDHFLYKPMKHIPVKGFEQLRISVSSTRMTEVEYRYVGRAIKILGGTFLDKLHKLQTLETDILICDVPEGNKYEFMSKTRCPIVKMDWLKCCIEEGAALPFKGFLLNEELNDKVKSEGLENPSRTSSASSGHRSNESLRSNSSSTINSIGFTQQPIPSDTPLENLVICIPSRVTGDHREMQDLVTEMGARLLTSYDSSASHLVHRGKATTEAKRDLRAAKRDNIFIVSPDWIYKCKESRIRVDERDYPETYDGKHLTLNTTTTILRTPQERPPLTVLPTRSSSPSARPSNRSGSSGRKRGSRSASVGFQPHRPGTGLSSPSQAFQGTAAGVTSAIFSGDSVSSSINMSSLDNSIDMSLMDVQSMEQGLGSHSDNFSVWQPVPLLPVTRSGSSRKRRRPAPTTEGGSFPSVEMDTSAICEAPDTTSDGTNIPEDYFDKSTDRYGEDAVYWVDVEGREKKRALLESLGYKTFKPSSTTGSSDSRLEALARDLESQRCPRYYFLLTGITLIDRGSFKKTIQQLGGIVLEDVNDNQDEWKEKCTHLITNGNNPPRTAKLVIAKACQAMIVNKGFIIASGEKGCFVDETPFRVNV
ncbi:DNA topoisomerase 2-binding protein 1 [Mortierella sp. AD011]|nr:DNA topoisomerase 2-binding protein 1 [Mortierella sp. AD011]